MALMPCVGLLQGGVRIQLQGLDLARLSGFDPLDNFFRVLSSQFPRRGEPEMGLNSL